jgi:hypothetical protein
MMSNMKELFGSGVLSEEVQSTLQEDWDVKVQQLHEEVEANLREEFSQRYAKVDVNDFVFREARLQDTKNRQNSIIANGAYIRINCTGGVTYTFNLTGLKSGYAIALNMEVTNGLAGLNFTNTIRWSDGIVPTLSSGVDFLHFVYNGSEIFGGKGIGAA